MSLRAFTRTIADGEESRIPVAGNLVFLRASTAQILVTARADRNNRNGVALTSRAPLSEGQKIDVSPDSFDDIVLRNESGASVDCTVIAGFGDYEAPLASVELDPNNTIGDAADVTCGAAATSLIAVSATRRKVHIKALATNVVNVRIGSATITTTRGVQLQPGEGITFECSAEIFGIQEGVGASDVSIVTESLV